MPSKQPAKAEIEDRRAVGYVRVSAVMGRDDLISPELQRHHIEKYAEREGYKIVSWVEDIGKSGGSFIRRQVIPLIKAIEDGGPPTIILWKWSRWGRNLDQSLMHLTAVREAGGQVRSATEDSDQGTTQGRFTIKQMLLISDFQRDLIADGWRDTHAKRWRDGLPHGAPNYFGYTIDEERRYVINEDEARILKDAYERIAVGETVRGIAQEWRALGLRTAKGNEWTGQALGRMLDVGFAAGYIRGKTDQRNNSVRLDAFDIWRKGIHEPIISEELWQAYCARRRRTAQIPPRIRTAPHALSGLLYCGLCLEDNIHTRLVTGTSDAKNNRHSWKCPRASDTKCHPFVSIGNNRATEEILAWVISQVGSGDMVVEEAERLTRAREAEANVKHYANEINRQLKRKQNLTRAVADGIIGPDDARETMAEITAELKVAREYQAAALEAEKATGGINRIEAFRGLAQEWDNYTPHGRREALSALFSRIVVYPGRKKGAYSRIEMREIWQDLRDLRSGALERFRPV